MDEKHFVCLGECEGVSETPGTCQAVECENFNHDLVTCDCEDGMHNKVKSEDSPSDDN